MAVQTNDHQYEGGGLHGKQFEKAQQLTEAVTAVPLNRHVPRHVQRHHDKRHHQIRRRQTRDEGMQVRRQPPATPP